MNLIGYVRVSTDEQAQSGHSTCLQPQGLRDWCARQGHALVEIVQDGETDVRRADGSRVKRGVSGGTLFGEREGGARVLAALRSGAADGLLVWKLDRAFRDSWDALTVARALRQRGLLLFSATESVDIHSRHGWMAFGVVALANEYERGKIVDRGIEVSAYLQKAGRVYGGIPYGCAEVAGALVRDPVTWPVRERIVTLRRTLSLRCICKQLQHEGVRNPSGGTLWHVSTILSILNNHPRLQHIPAAPEPIEAADSQRRQA